MAKHSEFKYVDFHSGNRDTKWVRTTKYNHLVEEHHNTDCFVTIQRFKDAVKESREEIFIAPLYFDLDCKDDVELARKEANIIVKFLTEELCIDSLAIRVYFSGSKGFHVIVHERVFGISPENYLHKVYKYIATFLSIRLAEDSDRLKTFDLSVYTNRRMIRLENTKHSTTGLYKIELTHEELEEFSVEKIKSLAIAPRGNLYNNKQLEAAARYTKEAAEFYEKHLKDYQDLSTYTKDSGPTDFNFNKTDFPVCVEHILTRKWNTDNRNNTTMQLAAYCKEAGYTEQEAIDLITTWVKKFAEETSLSAINKKIANTKNVIYTIYADESSYKFGCAFIRSLHGQKDSDGNYERVPCTGTLCPYIKKEKLDNDSIISLNLIETGYSDYTGKLVKTKVMVAGKKSTPYIVPYRLKYSCFSKCDKKGCPLYNMPKKVAFKELTTKDRPLIQMCGVGDTNILGILRDVSGIKKCSKFEIEVQESINIEELLVIPMVTTEDESNDYVLRKIYSIGNLGIADNRYYEMTGYVFPHPKNQEGTMIIQEAKPLQDVIESFDYTEEISRQLKIFKAGIGRKNMQAKLDEILDALTYNVTGIVERNNILLGILLVYHSALKIKVPWDSDNIRGWLETIIVGDTGTGKSAMVEKLQHAIGLGRRVNAESTSRTGLTYKMEQSNAGSWYIVWGAWPLADGELLWIDESAGIPKEEYGQMTLARSEGKLEVKRAVTAETNCRVRAVLTTNAVKGKRLSDYIQGIESLKYMFNNEDIRRFDFALFMKATDVAAEKYNILIEKIANTITAAQLKNNILFAWSRSAEDIIFTDKAIKLIMSHATNLSSKYGHATDIPIVSPSDQRNKLARMAVSLALLLHNVNEEDKVIVTEEHVDYIYDYLVKIYTSTSCGLHNYVKLAVKEEILTTDKFNKITEILKDNIGFLRSDETFTNFLKIFASQNYLRLNDLEAMLAIDKQDVKTMIQVLSKIKMIVSTTSGYRKTPRFNSYIERCFGAGILAAEDDDDELL